MESIKVGDAVVSLSGRDKGEILLVVNVDDKFVYLVNGGTRKVKSPKKKSVKHVKKVKSADVVLADKISKRLPVSDKRVRRSLFSVKE